MEACSAAEKIADNFRSAIAIYRKEKKKEKLRRQ
jgi:hypothetical protein